jgi:hypothetical protein
MQLPKEFYTALEDYQRIGFIKVGFSGSRKPLTPGQAGALRHVLNELKGIGVLEFHHSCCKGAEEEAHHIALEVGAVIVGHPQRLKEGETAILQCHKLRAPELIAKCKVDIVQETNVVITAPSTTVYDPNNATWFMTMYAQNLQRQGLKSLVVLEPEVMSNRMAQ